MQPLVRNLQPVPVHNPTKYGIRAREMSGPTLIEKTGPGLLLYGHWLGRVKS